jgi:hypothetical protein
MTYQKRPKGGHDGTVNYQMGQSLCPRCGSGAEVRTARELFDMMNGAREQAFQRANQFRQPGQSPGQWPGQGQGPGPGQWSGQGPGPRADQWPGQEAGQGQGPGQSAGQGTGQEAGQGTGQEAGQGTGQGPGQGPGQWPGQEAGQWPGQGPAQEASQWPAQGQGQNSADDDDYDHYNVEGDGNQNRNWGGRRDYGFDSGFANPLDDIGDTVLGAALGFAGRALGRRMKKAFEEKVVPAMQARAAQGQQQWEQSKAEQDAIVARYPELRGCTKDQVVFLDGGSRTVPIREIQMPVTLAQADSIVAQLR